ncbi:MAG: hypothetical protein LIO71_07785 [Ruminococcus sp.]|nr:hypothetical protein [Ruminococcus sp.]MCD7800910.1 hypothetical protein [Ruminococcus sp.]
MNCFYHEDRPVVGQCVDCGKFLCKECSSKYDTIICDECYQKRVALQHQEEEEYHQTVSDAKKEIVLRLVKSVVIFLVALLITSSWFESVGGKMFFAYFVAGFPYGLKAYNSLERSIRNVIIKYIYNADGVSSSISIISIILKLLVCFAIGGFCLPVVLVKDIQEFFKLNKLSN